MGSQELPLLLLQEAAKLLADGDEGKRSDRRTSPTSTETHREFRLLNGKPVWMVVSKSIAKPSRMKRTMVRQPSVLGKARGRVWALRMVMEIFFTKNPKELKVVCQKIAAKEVEWRDKSIRQKLMVFMFRHLKSLKDESERKEFCRKCIFYKKYFLGEKSNSL